MSVKHLTDDQLQALLDRGMSAMDRIHQRHLAECRVCRMRLHQYKQLYKQLSVDEGYDLPPGFSGAVVARVAALPTGSVHTWQPVALVAVIFAATLGVLGYFIDLSALSATILVPFQPLLEVATQYADKVRTALQAGGDVVVLLSAGLILLSVFALDHLIFRRHERHYCV